VSVPIVLQFREDAAQQGAATQQGKRRNFLFPAFLLNRLVPTALVLLMVAVAPFVISLLAGEPFGQQYPHSNHNSFANLFSNLAGALTVISLLTLLTKSEDLRRFVINGYPHQRVINAALFNLVLFYAVFYTFTSALVYSQEPVSSYPLLFLHPLINGIWIILSPYLGFAATACLVTFLASRSGRANRKIFKARDLILLEPILIYTFAMGVFSRPPDNHFGFFATLSPLVIFLITELMEILGPESSQERKLKLVPLTLKARFAITNLLVYTAIISVKLMIVQLIVLVLVIAAAFSAVYLFALYRERRQRQQAMGKIRAFSTEKAGDERFDQKVRAYHELREGK
jgi:hypothetical protein